MEVSLSLKEYNIVLRCLLIRKEETDSFVLNLDIVSSARYLILDSETLMNLPRRTKISFQSISKALSL